MSQIGTLTTGVGVVTTINLQYVPEFIVVGSSFTAGVLSGLAWNVGGKELVNLGSAAAVNAYAKYKNQGDLTNQLVNNTIATGMGYLPNQQFQLRLTNAGATTPAIYAFSRRRGNGQVLTASQQVVIDGANQRFSNFLSLQFLKTNVSRLDVTFKNAATGATFQETLAPAEIDSLFGLDNISEGGVLGTLSVVDNAALLLRRGIFVESCNLFASGANVTTTVEGIAQI